MGVSVMREKRQLSQKGKESQQVPADRGTVTQLKQPEHVRPLVILQWTLLDLQRSLSEHLITPGGHCKA